MMLSMRQQMMLMATNNASTDEMHELTDGMEITAIVSPDAPPPLVDSSDTDNE